VLTVESLWLRRGGVRVVFKRQSHWHRSQKLQATESDEANPSSQICEAPVEAVYYSRRERQTPPFD